MHKAILHWIDMQRPWVVVLIALVLLADFSLLAAAWLGPEIDKVFEGPDQSVCLRARQTQAKKDIEACCAGGAWPTWSACEGTVAKRRQDAEKEAAHRLNQSRRARWEEGRPSHYRYSFRFTCFVCRGISGFTFISEVTSGVPVLTATGQGAFGELYDEGFAKRYSTMEAVFDAIDAAIENQPSYSMGYSARWGYPKTFSWGVPYYVATDSMTEFEVIDFQVLPEAHRSSPSYVGSG
jgi:hypothetical protein